MQRNRKKNRLNALFIALTECKQYFTPFECQKAFAVCTGHSQRHQQVNALEILKLIDKFVRDHVIRLKLEPTTERRLQILFDGFDRQQ